MEQKDKSKHYFWIFYFDPKDNRMFVPKRFGIGWTVNFGNPRAVLLFVLTIAGAGLLAKLF
ncbi:hypothetical protein DRQ07_07700 [candidate division KSB1 bacterium]|nr:MAG: hypothetical protein DRQ07_07700 [candidate division KSB1 bacterium]